MSGIANSSLAAGPEAVRGLLARPGIDAVQIERPPLDELPYRDFVHALLGVQGFKLDFNRLSPAEALGMVGDRLLGPGAFARERELFAEDIAALAGFARSMPGGGPPIIAVRTIFAPGDLVWHVDRLNEPVAFRLLWPLGRPAGMRVTGADNIDEAIHRAFMRREHPLLGQLDTRVLRGGGRVEALWAHRPAQLEAMISGRFPFLRDPDKEWEIATGAASVHRVQTGEQAGTYHRSSWANRLSPGLQVVITAASLLA